PIGRHPSARVRMAVRQDGRAARSVYRVRSSFVSVSLLEVEPATGRTHQIRVHLSSIGHPIVGDPLYGGRVSARQLPAGYSAVLESFQGLALHARRLGFAHPRDGSWREFDAPPPEAFRTLLDDLRRRSERSPGAPGGAR